ncbi:MAG: ATP synthase subunit I [Eubacteriales bacterium]|nr:ATP synthase subunit I [Eubacteriales bacterium]
MKLQPASKKEVRRIALGVAVGDCILIPGLWLFSQFGIGTFRLLPILLGALGGSLVAVANFALMCLTVQKAVDIEDKKQMKARIQVSYNLRMLFQGAWCVIALIVRPIHVIAAVAPLLFPTLTIYYLQSKGKLVEPSDRKNPPQEPEDEDHLESFEV